MNPVTIHFRVSPCLFLLPLIAVGCPTDDVGGTSETETEGMETAGTDTGGEEGFCAEPAPPPGGAFAERSTIDVTISADKTEVLCGNIAADEDNILGLPNNYFLGDIRVLIEHPADVENGPLPDGRFPVLVFEHGSGHPTASYDHIWDRLTQNGTIVANIDGGLSSEGPQRAARMVCVSRWLAEVWPQREQLNCDLGIAGHSSGGEGALYATYHLQAYPESPEAQFAQRVVVGMAARRMDDSRHIPAQLAVPTVLFQGSVDNDVPGNTIKDYDLVAWEAEGIQGGAEKFILWMYDVEHEAFGGGISVLGDNTSIGINDIYPDISREEMQAKGEALAVEYFDAAIGLFLLGRDEKLPVLRGESFAEALESNPQWWQYLPANPDDRPMIFPSFVPSTPHRVPVDLIERTDKGLIAPANVEGFPALDEGVVQDVSETLTGEGNARHRTGAFEITWDGQGGSVSWDISSLDLSSATHLSFRVANMVDIEPVMSGGEVVDCISNDLVVPDLSFSVELRDDMSGAAVFEALPLIPVQDWLLVTNASSGDPFCSKSTFMRTIRISLDEFCPEVRSDQATNLVMRFGPRYGSPAGRVMLDTVEFHLEPGVDPGCPP